VGAGLKPTPDLVLAGSFDPDGLGFSVINVVVPGRGTVCSMTKLTLLENIAFWRAKCLVSMFGHIFLTELRLGGKVWKQS
jgi:hypothetical protein